MVRRGRAPDLRGYPAEFERHRPGDGLSGGQETGIRAAHDSVGTGGALQGMRPRLLRRPVREHLLRDALLQKGDAAYVLQR